MLNLTINERVYEVGCEDGQTEQVRALAEDLDARVRHLARQLGTQPEGRLLVMAALTLADDLSEARAALERAQAEVDAAASAGSRLAEGIESMAERIESIAERLERS